jgi:hypothetical protein
MKCVFQQYSPGFIKFHHSCHYTGLLQQSDKYREERDTTHWSKAAHGHALNDDGILIMSISIHTSIHPSLIKTLLIYLSSMGSPNTCLTSHVLLHTTAQSPSLPLVKDCCSLGLRFQGLNRSDFHVHHPCIRHLHTSKPSHDSQKNNQASSWNIRNHRWMQRKHRVSCVVCVSCNANPEKRACDA